MRDNPYREVGWRSEVGGRKWVGIVVGVRGGGEAEEEERERKGQEGCLSHPLSLFRWAAGLDELKHQNTETYQKRCVSSAVSDEMHSGKGSQGNRQDVDRTQMALAYSLKRFAATAFKRFFFFLFLFWSSA